MRWKKLFWLSALWALTAQAVCVNGHPSVASEFRSSKAVVVATVLDERQVPESADGYFLGGTMYHVKVEKRFKGSGSSTLEIFSENSSGRFDMTPGASYLLFIYEEDGRFSVSNCGNSGAVSKSIRTIQQVAKLARPKDS